MTTRMDADLKDFALRKSGTDVVGYAFRFGDCESFADTLEGFKRRIPLGERVPEPDKNWLWTVKHTTGNFMAMSDLFDNFIDSYLTASSQLSMF